MFHLGIVRLRVQRSRDSGIRLHEYTPSPVCIVERAFDYAIMHNRRIAVLISRIECRVYFLMLHRAEIMGQADYETERALEENFNSSLGVLKLVPQKFLHEWLSKR